MNSLIIFFTNAMLLLYTWLGNNFVLALIVLTVGVRLLLIPLTIKQQKSTAKMQELQPDIKRIQEKYKDDPQKMQAEFARIGYNPASMFGGCLFMLIQFPILIGMYRAILQAIPATPLQMMDLHNAINTSVFPHFDKIIPVNSNFLWMNLSQPDRLYLDILLPGVGIPILPVLVVLTTIVQQKLMTPTTTNPDDQSAQMQRSMMMMMPLMFGFFALQFASGLSIYFITANIVGIFQSAYLNREKFHWTTLRLPGGVEFPFPSFAAEPATAPAGPRPGSVSTPRKPAPTSGSRKTSTRSRKRKGKRKRARARKARASAQQK